MEKKIVELDDVVSKLDEIAEDGLEITNRVVDAPTGREINKALKTGEVDGPTFDAYASTADDIASKSGGKISWPQLKALWKRGNDYNTKARDNLLYEFNEVWLVHPTKVYPVGHKNAGKSRRFRLDSYDTNKIISRKATTLTEIKQSTFESYLKELVDKYPVGSKIANPNIGTTLSGNYFLEIPSINSSFPNLQAYRDFAANFTHKGQTFNIQIVLRPE